MIEFDNDFYVENDERLIYQLKDIELQTNGLAYFYFSLVCGYDYINPDENNVQGYVDKSNFIEEVQGEIVSCDIMNESLIEAINNDGFKKIDKLPKIFRKENNNG